MNSQIQNLKSAEKEELKTSKKHEKSVTMKKEPPVLQAIVTNEEEDDGELTIDYTSLKQR